MPDRTHGAGRTATTSPTTAGYGRELLSRFVPPSARARARGLALLSGALVARHRDALQGPVVELELPRRAALVGALRAARHADAVVAIAVPAALRLTAPDAAGRIVDEIVAAASEALFDRPLVLVARALPLPSGSPIDRLAEALYRDVDAGFTSFGVGAAAFLGDAGALASLCRPLLEQDLGLELELDAASSGPSTGDKDPALLLASLDDTLSDAGLQLAAVRGASGDDELGGGLLVTSGGQGARRELADDMLASVLARGGDDAHTEMSSFEAAERWLDAHGARGVAGRLLDALARET